MPAAFLTSSYDEAVCAAVKAAGGIQHGVREKRKRKENVLHQHPV
jgi:hypothetical protein